MARRNGRTRGKAIAPRNPNGAVREVTQAELLSASGQTPAGSVPTMATLLPRPASWPGVPFGPGMPLAPSPVNAVDPASGRPEPRIYEYPISWNLSGTANRFIPWALLRGAADRVSVFRACIEIRKDHMAGLDWDIVIGQGAIEKAQAASGGAGSNDEGRASVEDALRKRLTPEIDRCVEFMRTPDRGNGDDWPTWLRKFLEEHFVLDAVALYPRRTYGGELYSLEILDGSTIKPLLDERGGRPLPPYPAYQQILYGFPRGEFVAEAADDGTIPGAYPSDQLIYLRRTARVWSPYGLSAVERALDDGALWIKRHEWMKAEYNQGTSIAGLYTVESSDWFQSPDQLLEYERELNSAYSGDTAARQGIARLLAPGIKPVASGLTGSDAIAEKYKPDYDLYLLKLAIMHFDTTLPELGFTDAAAGGLGASGYHEGQANVQERKRLPVIKYVESALTRVLREYLNMPPELEFRFMGLDDEDEPGADDVDTKRQASGVLTLNERRDALGLPRYDFPEADMPMIVTARGVIYLDGSSELEPPGTVVGPFQGPPLNAGPQPGQEGAVPDASSPPAGEGKNSAAGGASGKSEPTPPAPVGGRDAKKSREMEQYRQWTKARPFNFEHWATDELLEQGVDLAKVTLGPKARRPGPAGSGT